MSINMVISPLKLLTLRNSSTSMDCELSKNENYFERIVDCAKNTCDKSLITDTDGSNQKVYVFLQPYSTQLESPSISVFLKIIHEAVTDFAYRKIVQLSPDCDLNIDAGESVINFITSSGHLTAAQRSIRIVKFIFAHHGLTFNRTQQQAIKKKKKGK